VQRSQTAPLQSGAPGGIQPLKAYYCDQYVLPLPQGHRFPMAKYGRLRERVESELRGVRLTEPEAALSEDLWLAHDPSYVSAVFDGSLSTADLRAIGFPWSSAMVERARRSVGATIAACGSAFLEGVAVNLAGGTHHSQRERGSGYCVFNDAVVAARRLQRDQARDLRIAVVDLDVHQGDGTAQIVADDPSIFTLSIHGERNFPAKKVRSDLDVGLPDRTSDEAYLVALGHALETVAERFDPEFIIYLAGADAHCDDRLGRLALTTEGMARRDQVVFEFAERLRAPVAVAMAGGYGHDIETTVGIHFRTIDLALQAWSRRASMRQPLVAAP
jgi:acetoin utilization deacetylase AcuC-like enzyme